jgi:hypothetical protein
MLWSYAKLPVAPPAVVFALVHKITDQLVLQAHRPDGASTFDAQVRCFWLLLSAHVGSGLQFGDLRAPGGRRGCCKTDRAALDGGAQQKVCTCQVEATDLCALVCMLTAN